MLMEGDVTGGVVSSAVGAGTSVAGIPPTVGSVVILLFVADRRVGTGAAELLSEAEGEAETAAAAAAAALFLVDFLLDLDIINTWQAKEENLVLDMNNKFSE
jgi:hypothetical protein